MFNEDVILEPSVWGPHYWYFLHTIAFCYPLYPNSITKKKYYEFVYNFYLFIPNKVISTYFNKLLDKYPVAPYLDNRESFVRWTHFIHNKINKKLNKPIISLKDFYKNYKIKNKNPNGNHFKYNKIFKNVIFIIFIIIFSFLIYYFYNK